MGMRIGTNLQALGAQRGLATSRSEHARAQERLASGQRINRAADDASGLAISSKMNAKARSMGQALRNAQDGISVVQVAEGAMNETSGILVRLRELAIQAASDTIGDEERSMLNREVVQLRREIDRIAETTEFNGTKLLTGGGSWPTLEIQIGTEEEAATNRARIDRREFNTKLEQLGLYGVDFSSKEDAREFLGDIDSAISDMSRARASLGALQNGLESIVRNLAQARENTLSSKSRILDADFAEEAAASVKGAILSQASTAMLAQANQSPAQAIRLLENS